AEFRVQSQRQYPYRTSVAIVSGVRDVLEVDGGEEPGHEACGVVGLRDGFATVVERAIANQEIEATAREISGVNAGDAGGGHFGGNCVVRPFPASAVDGNAGGCKTIESSEREAFG